MLKKLTIFVALVVFVVMIAKVPVARGKSSSDLLKEGLLGAGAGSVGGLASGAKGGDVVGRETAQGAARDCRRGGGARGGIRRRGACRHRRPRFHQHYPELAVAGRAAGGHERRFASRDPQGGRGQDAGHGLRLPEHHQTAAHRAPAFAQHRQRAGPHPPLSRVHGDR